MTAQATNWDTLATPRDAIDAINHALNALDWEQVGRQLKDAPVYVCDATEDEWGAFVDCDYQVLRSNFMFWHNGKILIIELPSRHHEDLVDAVSAVIKSAGTVTDYLCDHRAAAGATGGRNEADSSFGPKPNKVIPLGASAPKELVGWGDFQTLKVEVGVSQTWGNAVGSLDWKARLWTKTVGVRYVLCVAHDVETDQFTYKHYRVSRGKFVPARQRPMKVTADSETVVQFDSRLLLGIPRQRALPAGFPDSVGVNLSAVLLEAREYSMRVAPSETREDEDDDEEDEEGMEQARDDGDSDEH